MLWIVFCYNELDSKFGYDPKPSIYYVGERAVAKSIARHMNKISPDFITYWAEEEPWRWV